MTTLADHWSALASVGLLGTDRRPAPDPPPGALHDLLDADPPADHAESVLAQVAAVAAARRAGLRPAPVLPTPEPCPLDERPLCPPAALRRLFELLEAEPVLVDDGSPWRRRRLPLHPMRRRVARSPSPDARRDIVVELAGPLAE
jgi:hypothetical protein